MTIEGERLGYCGLSLRLKSLIYEPTESLRDSALAGHGVIRAWCNRYRTFLA